jgi:hypothetical protein
MPIAMNFIAESCGSLAHERIVFPFFDVDFRNGWHNHVAARPEGRRAGMRAVFRPRHG